MSTLRDVTLTKAYRSLASEDLQWFKITWGDAMAIGWKGSDPLIRTAHTLFSNYDLRPSDDWGNAPAAPRLTWLSHDMGSNDMAYVYMSEKRMFETLRFYFEIQLLLNHETGTGIKPTVVVSERFVRDVEEPQEGESSSRYAARLLALLQGEADEMNAIQVEEFTPEASTWVDDTILCGELAKQCAAHFIEHHILTKSFLPEPAQTLLAEHSIGRGDKTDPHAEFESVVDQAATA